MPITPKQYNEQKNYYIKIIEQKQRELIDSLLELNDLDIFKINSIQGDMIDIISIIELTKKRLPSITNLFTYIESYTKEGIIDKGTIKKTLQPIKLTTAFKEKNKKNKSVLKNYEFKISDKNIYFVSDLHGDIIMLLGSIIGNKDDSKNIAKFKPNAPHIVYRDIRDNQSHIYEDISQFKDEDLIYLVPIANLIINENFVGTFILGGDLTDRGDENESCFYTFENLLNQNLLLGRNKKNIIYEMGNHEGFLFSFNDIIPILYINNTIMPSWDPDVFHLNSYSTMEKFYERIKITKHFEFNKMRIVFLKQSLFNLIEQDQIKLVYTKNNTIFCHSTIENKLLAFALNIVVLNFDKINMLHIHKNELMDLTLKIQQNKVNLNLKEIEIVSNVLNRFLKYYCIEANIEVKQKCEELFIILLDSRAKGKNIIPIKGVYKIIVGHSQVTTPRFEINFAQHLYTDIGGGYRSKEINEERHQTKISTIEIDENGEIFNNFSTINRDLLIKFHKKEYTEFITEKSLIEANKLFQNQIKKGFGFFSFYNKK